MLKKKEKQSVLTMGYGSIKASSLLPVKKAPDKNHKKNKLYCSRESNFKT